jgi:hypothetical protein
MASLSINKGDLITRATCGTSSLFLSVQQYCNACRGNLTVRMRDFYCEVLDPDWVNLLHAHASRQLTKKILQTIPTKKTQRYLYLDRTLHYD